MTRRLKSRLDSKPSECQPEDSLAVLVALRRDAILEAIAASASVLLHSSDIQTSLQKIVEQLGRATGVDRVHIFKVDSTANATDAWIDGHSYWSAPGVVTPPTFAHTFGTFAEVGLGGWLPRLLRGEVIVGHTRNLEPSARKFFELGFVKSVLCIPVFASDQLWGMIGVDNCRSEHDWLPTELAALKTLAELIGAAVGRQRNLAKLADATHIIEASPTILYRMSAQEHRALTFVSQNIQQYGYSAEELMASPARWMSLIDEEHRPALLRALNAIIAGRTDLSPLEFRLLKPNGTYAWFEGRGYPLRDAAQRIVAVEGVISDVTERKSFEQRLTFTNALLAAQLECSPNGILVVDNDSRIVSVNRRFLEMWHVPEDLVGPGLHGPVLSDTPEDAPVLAVVASHVKDRDAFEARVRSLYEHPDEESHDALETTDGCFIERYTQPLRDGAGHHLGRIWFFSDVTDWKEAQDALRQSEEKFRNIFGSVNDGIIIIDPATVTIVDINPRGCTLFGYPHDELAGHDAGMLLSGRPPYTSYQAMKWLQRPDSGKPQTFEWECKAKDGHLFWCEASLRQAKFGLSDYLLVVLRDITDRKRIEAEIMRMARQDALTGLANRPVFIERIELALARARRGAGRFGILYLDLDHFKDVNDTLGHPLGDALLCATADRLRNCVRETDLVARFGGDEFAVLQDEMPDLASAEQLATKITNVLAVPYMLEGNQVRTTASIGIVPYSDEIESADSMMMKADLALYRAKDEGRNQFRFHVSELDREVRERVETREDLRRAIDRGEFLLLYQPQVDLKSGRITGLEALIRWNHPTRGQLLPAAFIPIAETTGYISAIGQWVIEQACRQIRDWRNLHDASVRVAVNVSFAQFKLESHLDRMIAETLAKYQLDPDALELELTESVLMETTAKCSEAFERLRQLGVRLAIDDFGTGYSSLDYLRLFHVSRLKIDQRFVEGVTDNPDDAKIVRATIGLANALDIETVAEGVETAGQKQFLIDAGCEVAQGNLLGEPMPADRITALLRKNTPSSAN